MSSSTTRLTRRRPGARRRPLLAGIAASLAAMVVLAGCASDAGDDGGDGANPTGAETSAEAGEAVDGGEVIWAVETEPTTLNGQVNGQNKAKLLLRNLFDSYLFKNADGTYDPWLAESYAYSDDETELTLVLQDGITFSDGEVLDAEAVVANIEQLQVEGYSAQAAFSLRSVEAVTAVDELTVLFELAQPDAFLLDFLASLNGAPISPSSIENAADLLAGGADVAGVGPFVFSSYTAGQDLVLERREDYAWAPAFAGRQGPAHLDQVTYRFLPEASTRTGALSAGQVDLIDGVPSVDVPLFADSDEFSYDRVLNNGLPYTYYFNIADTPLSDPAVREAFQIGFDLDAVLQGVHHGQVERAWAPVSPVSPFYDPAFEGAIEVDVDRANELLDDAGWSERDADGIRVRDGETLTLRAVAASPFLRDNRELLGQAISAELRSNVGIDFQFQAVDLGTAQDAATAGDYEVFDNSRGDADSGQPLVYLYSTGGLIARGNFENAELDDLLTRGSQTNDLDERIDLYAQAQQIIAEEFYTTPIYVPQDNVAARSTLHGVEFDEAGGVIWSAYNIWTEDE